MIGASNRMQDEILNLKIKVIKNRRRMAQIRLQSYPSVKTAYFYIGWDRCFRKNLYRLVGE
ncbi:hypothetical protein [Aliarcobacter butzleri]|uniref:hypothetical protein n=1 Tax=Aliarcobacter butzleri TaxID=28197 RepID=UPI00263E81D2|nr:hypothetical protein [Aliarcobacter butzleri]MDN5091026.1 hypothetical protein [Aliarcobacter butzleri]